MIIVLILIKVKKCCNIKKLARVVLQLLHLYDIFMEHFWQNDKDVLGEPAFYYLLKVGSNPSNPKHLQVLSALQCYYQDRPHSLLHFILGKISQPSRIG